MATTGGHSDIFRGPATGGAATQIAFGARNGCDDTAPTWSPDSSTIAFVRSGDTGCANPGLVVQPVGGAARTIVPGTVIGPSFAERAKTQADIVDGGDNCNEGDNCSVAMVGASRVHGWGQVSTF